MTFLGSFYLNAWVSQRGFSRFTGPKFHFLLLKNLWYRGFSSPWEAISAVPPSCLPCVPTYCLGRELPVNPHVDFWTLLWGNPSFSRVCLANPVISAILNSYLYVISSETSLLYLSFNLPCQEVWTCPQAKHQGMCLPSLKVVPWTTYCPMLKNILFLFNNLFTTVGVGVVREREGTDTQTIMDGNLVSNFKLIFILGQLQLCMVSGQIFKRANTN